jgi:hypothetical protein
MSDKPKTPPILEVVAGAKKPPPAKKASTQNPPGNGGGGSGGGRSTHIWTPPQLQAKIAKNNDSNRDRDCSHIFGLLVKVLD